MKLFLIATALSAAAMFAETPKPEPLVSFDSPPGAQFTGAEKKAQRERGKPGYVFCFFRGNGMEGVFLAASQDGVEWREMAGGKPVLVPKVGRKVDWITRDPSVCKGPDGMYHMVWTCGGMGNGFGIAHSKDLLNWSEQEVVKITGASEKSRNTWAPEICWDEPTQQYVVIWSSTIDGLFPETANNGHLNHRIYVSTTRDFKTWTPSKLFYDGGFNVIDAFTFKVDGRYGMIVKDETFKPVAQKNLHVVWSEGGIMGPWGKAEPAFTDNTKMWVEGPTVLHVGDRWLVYFDAFRNQCYAAVETKDFKTFSPLKITMPHGVRHGTTFAVDSATMEGLLRQDENLRKTAAVAEEKGGKQ